MLLVTGITGLTGRFLYREILEHTQMSRLICLIRTKSDISWMTTEKPSIHYGDVNNVKDIIDSMQGVSTVIHLVNMRQAPQIISACKESRVRRVIFVNTTGMFSKYQAYSSLYRQLEDKILTSGLDYTIIRPTMIYGNNQDKNIHKLVTLINKAPIFPVIGSGESLMQPIYAGDLAKVIYKASLEDASIKKEYNVAGKEPISYLNILTEIANALGKKRCFVHIPYKIALLAALIGDYVPNGLINVEKVRRLSEDKVFCYAKAKQDLAFDPISFREGIKLEMDSLKLGKII